MAVGIPVAVSELLMSILKHLKGNLENVLRVPFIVRLHSCRIEARQSGLRAKYSSLLITQHREGLVNTYASLLCSTIAQITESHPTYLYQGRRTRTLKHSRCRSSWA